VAPGTPSGKFYCGSCQFNDREACAQLNGICWYNYLNYAITEPFSTNACLSAIVPICYSVWSTNGFADPQCLDFIRYIDVSKLGVKPVLLAANYTSNGRAIWLYFDTPIKSPKNDECSTSFDSNTLKYLPLTRGCRSIAAKIIEVDFDPQKGIMKYLTINNDAFYSDDKYFPVSANSTKVQIGAIPVIKDIIIRGLNTVSECDSIDLFAITNNTVAYPLTFKWSIEYNAELPPEKKTEFDSYFDKYTKDFSTNSSLTIPQGFMRKGSKFIIRVYANAAHFPEPVPSEIKEIKVHGDIPKITFVSHARHVWDLKLNSQINIPFQIDTKKCQSYDYENTKLFLIPIEVSFIVKSGTNTSDIFTRSRQEIAIENNILSVYNKFKALIVGNSAGFEYDTYYNVTVVAKDLDSGMFLSDSVLLIFLKPDIQSAITISDTLISTSTDAKLSAAGSYIPVRDDDAVRYVWSCVKAESLSVEAYCICPELPESKLHYAELIIPKDKLTAQCKYKYSVIVSATSRVTGNIRSAFNETEFYVYDGPALPLKTKMVDKNSADSKLAAFSVVIPDDDSTEKPTYQWKLLEAESLDPKVTEFYSIKGTFLYDFMASTMGINANPELKENDKDFTDPETRNITYLEQSYLTKLDTSVLGIDKSKLFPDFKYTFGVVITKRGVSTLQLVSFASNPSIKPRIILVSPREGIGFETQFAMKFSMENSYETDDATYQIYRRNCPNSENPMVALTEKIRMANTYTLIMAPGMKACNFSVEIILRVYEYSTYKDFNTNVTVMEPYFAMEKVVRLQLTQLIVNHDLTFDQKLSLCAELARIPILDSPEVAKFQQEVIFEQISSIDSPGGVIEFLDSKAQCEIITTNTEILSDLIVSQKPFIDVAQSNQYENKVESLLMKVKTKQGGTYIIPSALGALSNLADIESAEQDEDVFTQSMQNSMTLMRDMKLDEMIIGAVPFLIDSPAISDSLKYYDKKKIGYHN